jgi:DNA-binding LytR/AlgR family response regulator
MTEALKPDLLLLDIAMPGLDGIDVARALTKVQRPPVVVFVTAFDTFAVAAFDVDAVDYVMKPVAEERLARAVERARERIANRSDAGPPPLLVSAATSVRASERARARHSASSRSDLASRARESQTVRAAWRSRVSSLAMPLGRAKSRSAKRTTTV